MADAGRGKDYQPHEIAHGWLSATQRFVLTQLCEEVWDIVVFLSLADRLRMACIKKCFVVDDIYVKYLERFKETFKTIVFAMYWEREKFRTVSIHNVVASLALWFGAYVQQILRLSATHLFVSG